MTEKEKAKAYDEAIERAKKSYGNRIAEEIFPELKEDDTERIKKNCIHFLELQKQHHAATFEIEECIAWLEKQGKNSTDKTKPRFKIGDWIVFNGLILYVKEVVNGFYRTISKGAIPNSYDWDIDNIARLWTIQDAKDGDVLSFYSEYKGNKMVQVGLIEKYVGKHGGCSNTFKIYVGVNWDNNLQMGKYMGCSDIHPATKEQRDLLFQKIKEAGYKWNDKTKTLNPYDNDPKNNVHFFVKRVSIYHYSLCVKGKYRLHTIITKLSLSDFGLNTDDFADMKEGEIREVFLNMED